ncbi:putative monooxygenase YcnE [Microbacterium oxydans]|uniref:Putative monooxygenase YcnE n=1 Tax=Microbacterium oxydans TaxID=82380 RepID=A0A0F0KWF4_9MICO|nr:antibiotic biosynthesis monooxygenase [Microbacterium oxydans]KJL25237.1 putative monooxygenase YcnE [Microbacterium oxydans]
MFASTQSRRLCRGFATSEPSAGNQDYVLFESRSEPGTFYMREAFDDRAALDTHFATPHFQAFADGVDALLAAPLELLFLDRRSE